MATASTAERSRYDRSLIEGPIASAVWKLAWPTMLQNVIAGLQGGGLQITAVHNHLIGETPRVMYVHYWGQAPEATLAAALKSALQRSATPLQPPAARSGAHTRPARRAPPRSIGP